MRGLLWKRSIKFEIRTLENDLGRTGPSSGGPHRFPGMSILVQRPVTLMVEKLPVFFADDDSIGKIGLFEFGNFL